MENLYKFEFLCILLKNKFNKSNKRFNFYLPFSKTNSCQGQQSQICSSHNITAKPSNVKDALIFKLNSLWTLAAVPDLPNSCTLSSMIAKPLKYTLIIRKFPNYTMTTRLAYWHELSTNNPLPIFWTNSWNKRLAVEISNHKMEHDNHISL